MILHHYKISVALFAAIWIIAGCSFSPSTDPSRFYILSSVASSSISDEPGPALGVGRVELPAYTDRPQIVTRTGSNELYLSEFHRWAEPLDVSFSRAISGNLSILLNTEQVTSFPWLRSFDRDCEVFIRVIKFDARPQSNEVEIAARWRITAPREGDTLADGESTIIEPITNSGGYAAMVEAWDRAVAQLAADIASAIDATLE